MYYLEPLIYTIGVMSRRWWVYKDGWICFDSSRFKAILVDGRDHICIGP